MTYLIALPVPLEARYVPVDRARRAHINGCPWCQWGAGNPGTAHRFAVCLACGVPQCARAPECAACLYGWLPGWHRGTLTLGRVKVTADPKVCGYAKCEELAVANAPRVGRVCFGHLERAKLAGRPLADVMVASVAEALDPRGRFGAAGWRKLELVLPA